MAANATVKLETFEFIHDPTIEVVELTVSDGEQYISRKFKTVLGAVITRTEDTDGFTNVVPNGQTVIIHGASASDTDMTLLLFGIR